MFIAIPNYPTGDAAVSIIGDVSVDENGNATVEKIRGNDVAAGVPTDGQVYIYNATTQKFEPADVPIDPATFAQMTYDGATEIPYLDDSTDYIAFVRNDRTLALHIIYWGDVIVSLHDPLDIRYDARYYFRGVPADIVADIESLTGVNKLTADALQDGATNKVVTGTEKTAWNNKADANHNHDSDYADISHVADTNNPHSVNKADVGLPNVDNTSDANKPVAVRRTTQTGLACDFTSHSYIIATISANSSFTITNLPTDQMVTVLINNTNQTDVTVTLPNTADVKPSADYVIGGGGGKYREFSIYFDGFTRYWQVSEELV